MQTNPTNIMAQLNATDTAATIKIARPREIKKLQYFFRKIISQYLLKCKKCHLQGNCAVFIKI